MKKQRKLLTHDERYKICRQQKEQNEKCPENCPLMDTIMERKVCIVEVEALESQLRQYWNKEVEVNV